LDRLFFLTIILLVAVLPLPLHIPILVTLADVLSLIYLPLAPRETYFKLGLAILEVDRESNGGETSFGDALGNAVDLVAMEQQLTWTLRLVVIEIGILVLRDVTLHKVEFVVDSIDKGLSQGGLAGT
jgi:hypothetical protein